MALDKVTQPVLQYLNFLFINLLDVNFTCNVSETSFWDSYRVDIVLFDILHQFFTLDEVLFWISVDWIQHWFVSHTHT
jgi:hypothetical protein